MGGHLYFHVEGRAVLGSSHSVERDRLFLPFERGRTQASGSGLGLTIARGFVRAHGGQLWVEDGPGSGSRFVFTLPVDSAGA